MNDVLLVVTNVPDQQSALALSEKLINLRVAACVNCLVGVQSLYLWQGKIERATEVTLHIKTTRERYAELERAIREMHPYDVPEIIAMPVVQGLPDYLNWVEKEISRDNAVGT